MSFSLKVYAIEIKSVAALYGSGNLVFANEIISSNPVRITEINDWTDAEINAEKALYEIMEGKLSCFDGEIYANVLELICSKTGEKLAANEWEDLSMNWLMEMNMEASLPIGNIPVPRDFPYVLTISNKTADEFVSNLRALDVEEAAARKEAEMWIQKLLLDKKDLILFFY